MIVDTADWHARQCRYMLHIELCLINMLEVVIDIDSASSTMCGLAKSAAVDHSSVPDGYAKRDRRDGRKRFVKRTGSTRGDRREGGARNSASHR